MEKYYIVQEGEYEDVMNVAVFPTKEQAEQWIGSFGLYGDCRYFIDETDFCPDICKTKRTEFFCKVTFSKTFHLENFDAAEYYEEKSGTVVRDHYYRYILYLSASSKKEAIEKALNKLRTETM